MSAIGTKRTSPSAQHMSAIGGKADIVRISPYVPLVTPQVGALAMTGIWKNLTTAFSLVII